MRRGIWVVLGLVGLAPVGALAQQRPGQASTDESIDDTDRPIIIEMPATGGRQAGRTGSGSADVGGTDVGGLDVGGTDVGGTASGQTGTGVTVSRPSPGTATGGSGMNAGRSAQATASNQEVFQGTLRAVTGDQLRMVDGDGRVFEFGLGERTRIIGPNGAALSRQVLREGMPVRTVTQPGASENEVVTLQVFGPAPAPSR
jgi:hypothetical protein